MVDPASADLRRMAPPLQTIPAFLSPRILGAGLPDGDVYGLYLPIGKGHGTGFPATDPEVFYLYRSDRLGQCTFRTDLSFNHYFSKNS